MTDNVVKLPRLGLTGFYSIAEVPQPAPVTDIAMSTGWPMLDEYFKFYPGQFVMMTGLPGSGKSTFAMNLLINAARNHGIRSFIFVPENERHIRDKLKMIYGGLQHEFDLFATDYCFIQVAEYENWWEDPQDTPWLLERAMEVCRKYEIGMVLVDPWNELERAKGRDQSMTDYIGNCLIQMKRFTHMAEVVYMMLAHPTKDVCKDKRTPTLADIEGSQAWYNKCDNGLILEREYQTNMTRVISAKVRERGAGKIGECKFHVDPRTERFTPVSLSGGDDDYGQR